MHAREKKRSKIYWKIFDWIVSRISRCKATITDYCPSVRKSVCIYIHSAAIALRTICLKMKCETKWYWSISYPKRITQSFVYASVELSKSSIKLSGGGQEGRGGGIEDDGGGGEALRNGGGGGGRAKLALVRGEGDGRSGGGWCGALIAAAAGGAGAVDLL